MGGKSKSSSSTTNQNINVDERVAVDGNGVLYNQNVDGDNNSLSVTVTDNGAIEKAFEFANKNNSESFNFANNVVNQSYNSLDDMLDFVKESQNKSYAALSDNTRLAFDFANNATVSADERIVSNISKMIPMIVIGIVVLGLFFMSKNSRRGRK